MSGSNSSGGKSGGRGGGSGVSNSGGGRAGRGGWEEAGNEFYQESYPGGAELDSKQNIATLLPSKQLRGTTVRRRRPAAERRQSTAARNTATRDVLVSMLPDLSENLSNEETTWEEIMQIKAMPVPMSQKRELKAQLQSATKLRLQGFEQLQWRRRKAWQGTRARIKEILGKLELWKGSFKKIEGNFGTGVVAYFVLLKWLLFLNFVISLFIIAFIIVPSEVIDEYIGSDEDCDPNILNSTQCCTEKYFNNTIGDGNFILDIIQGTGSMEKTLLFYGTYTHNIYKYYIGGLNEKLSFYTDANGSFMYYDLPLAYILIPIVYFSISLMAIVKSAAKGFKERLVEGEGQFYQYCNLVFGGWDFCIHNEKSANIKHKALFNEIKGCLERERLEEERQTRSKEEQFKLIVLRIIVNFMVLCVLAGSGVLIYYTFDFSVKKLNNMSTSAFLTNNTKDLNFQYSGPTEAFVANVSEPLMKTAFSFENFNKHMLTSDNKSDSDLLSAAQIFLLQYLPSICIVGLNIVVPIIFQYLVQFENYTPAFVVKISLIRTVFLRLSSLGVLLSQLYLLIIENESTHQCDASKDTETTDDKQLHCWETYVGQQLYKLLIADFAIQIIVTFFVNFPRAFIAKHTENRCFKLIGEQEFHLPKHVLDVVYSQTLCWLGAFYCPFLPLIATVQCFLMFYIKKFTCLVNSKPPSVVYRASKSNSLFMVVLLISFCIAIIPLGYAIAELHPSRGCGPFRNLSTVWEELVYTFNNFPPFLKHIIFLMGTYVFAVPAFIVLSLSLYYYWAVAGANRHMVSVLKSQLVLEGHDKQFLLNRLSAFIRQQQKRNERARQHHAHTTNVEDDDSIRQSSR